MDHEENYQEEKHFSKLNSQTFEYTYYLMKGDDQSYFEAIVEATTDIVDKFKEFQFMSIDFSSFDNLLAYFSAFSTLNTAVARNRFLDAFHKCDILRTIVEKSEINIISLGGGPGTDIIGFLSALHEVMTEENKTLNITIADMWKHWKTFYNIAEFLCLSTPERYGNVSKVFHNHNVCSTFMCVDLTDQRPFEKYLNDLSRSDIVILSRVLDGYNWKVDPNIEEPILQNIARSMKNDGLLLVIDCFVYRYEVDGLEKIYCSKLGQFQMTFQEENEFGSHPHNSSKAEIAIFKKNKQ